MAIVSGPSLAGGGSVMTYINAGSNDASGVAQQLANIVSQGLNSSPVVYTRTNGPAPASGLGVYTITAQNVSITNQPGVTVALVAGSTAAQANDSVVVSAPGQAGQILIGDNENITYNTAGGSGSVVTGDGNDFIGTPVSGFASSTFNITTGAGNDVIVAAVGKNAVSPGGGANFVFTGGGIDTVSSSGNDTISGVGGAAGTLDTVYEFGGSILVGSFAKNLLFVGSAATATVLAGLGSYTVNGGTGANLIAGGTAGNNFLGGGTGSTGSTLFGGGANDVLLARGSGVNLIVAGGGNETLTGAGSTGNNIFFTTLGAAAATANAAITGGAGNDTYFVGSGASTVDSGAGGSDLAVIVNGRAGGSVVLNNFQAASQHVQLQGYSASELANDLAFQVNVGGSARLTLSDHTTITFTGIANVNSNNFM